MRSIFFVIHQVLPWYLWIKWINSLVKNKILIAIYRSLWQCQIFFDKINIFFDKRIMSNKNCKNSLDFLFFFITYHNRRSGRKIFCWSRQLKKFRKIWISHNVLYSISHSIMANTNNQALKEAFMNIEKQFWKWAIMKMWDNANVGLVNTSHSGSYVLDLILGGGYPEGRVIEIYGPE